MKRDGAHDPRAIANKILEIRAETGEPTTVMQLIKLVYIADGWSLALRDRPLANQNPEAWQYGPVYRDAYNAFRQFGAQPVTSPAYVRGTDLPYVESFSEDEEKLLRAVVSAYGKLSAFSLSRLTHQPGTPWSDAYENGAYSEISADDMKAHFESLKEKRLAAKASAQIA
ncbi:Panacea domain-containing protein [Sphingosinicella terrae]|uniref:Panacea domain-containing protein n=1 Tax=Sphingosinicella terrae TaxID=2172047 RepID=UPI000E0D1859|nr:type II toxin-antitoxin system antitoxin SocA domain-containing protein [Sphingosinicella terrae]